MKVQDKRLTSFADCRVLLLCVTLPIFVLPQLAAATRRPQELEIVTDRLPDGIVGKTYRARLQARGGEKPYSWSLATPYLPEGLTLSETTGEIDGTPKYAHLYNLAAHPYDFTLQVTDSSSPAQTATRYFVLRVVEPLELENNSLPKGVLGFSYRMHIKARGGIPPYKWQVARGELPPGLELKTASGLLAGEPTQSGSFRFTVQVSDAGNPAQTEIRTFRSAVVAPLSVDWKQPPQVEAGGIFGSVQVTNGTQDDFEVTVIIVAVNEYGKAFALGYQHFLLEKDTVSREILFGFGLPEGEYEVHVDAVAEVQPKNAIYRARRQHGPLQVE